MIVDRINIPVCKPCPKCGMPTIQQYHAGVGDAYVITCKKKCAYVSNFVRGEDYEAAIEAWNLLIAGKEPEIARVVDVPVVYNTTSYDVKKVGAEMSVAFSDIYKARFRDRVNILDNARVMCYHQIADELMKMGIGETYTKEDLCRESIVTRVAVDVVDKKRQYNTWRDFVNGDFECEN